MTDFKFALNAELMINDELDQYWLNLNTLQISNCELVEATVDDMFLEDVIE